MWSFVPALLASAVLGSCGKDARESARPAEDTAVEDTAAEGSPRFHGGLNDLAQHAAVEVIGSLTPPAIADLTGDGVPDYVFGFDRATVVAGPLPARVELMDDSDVVARILEGEPAGNALDMAVGTTGDASAVLALSDCYDPSPGDAEYCATRVFSGPWGGERVLGDTSGDSGPAAVIVAEDPTLLVGASLSWGDTDQDGSEDLLIGAPVLGRQWDQGVAFLLSAPLSGTYTAADADTVFVANPGTAGLGHHVDVHGDYDGDGTRDAAVVAFYAHRRAADFQVFVMGGPFSAAVVCSADMDTRMDLRLGTHRAQVDLATGDYQGDGYDDLVVTSLTAERGQMAVLVFPGPLPTHLGPTGASVAIETEGGGIATRDGASLGQDLDADGRDDLVLGLPYYDTGEWGGGVFVFYAPLSGHLAFTEADAQLRVRNEECSGRAGLGRVVPAGDLDGDGQEDFFTSGCGGFQADPSELHTYGILGVGL